MLDLHDEILKSMRASLHSDEGTVTLPGALILRFDPNGYCEELREYWHLDPDRAIPAPEGWGQ